MAGQVLMRVTMLRLFALLSGTRVTEELLFSIFTVGRVFRPMLCAEEHESEDVFISDSRRDNRLALLYLGNLLNVQKSIH